MTDATEETGPEETEETEEPEAVEPAETEGTEGTGRDSRGRFVEDPEPEEEPEPEDGPEAAPDPSGPCGSAFVDEDGERAVCDLEAGHDPPCSYQLEHGDGDEGGDAAVGG